MSWMPLLAKKWKHAISDNLQKTKRMINIQMSAKVAILTLSDWDKKIFATETCRSYNELQ